MFWFKVERHLAVAFLLDEIQGGTGDETEGATLRDLPLPLPQQRQA